jgi:hypothetical protein
VLATGGTPSKGAVPGAEHAVTTWDILSGAAVLGPISLVYDDNGSHPAPSCAEFMAARGTRVELATPDRHLGAEMGATNFPIHLRELYRQGVKIAPDLRLASIRREGNRLAAVLLNVYTLREETRVVDQVVIEHGTMPRDELYAPLKMFSANLGGIDLDALATNQPQERVVNEAGRFQLYRVGDVLASRNIHAAIYDSLRLAKDF